MSEIVNKSEALLQVYQMINRPVKAGTKWVTYSREQVETILDTMKQVLIAEGYEFRSTN